MYLLASFTNEFLMFHKTRSPQSLNLFLGFIGLLKVSRKVMTDKISTVPDHLLFSQPFHILASGNVSSGEFDSEEHLNQH